MTTRDFHLNNDDNRLLRHSSVELTRCEGVFSNSSDCSLLRIPSFVDVHVHLREPGFFYKESISSGTMAAASAGYGHIFAMPNLNPVPDSLESLNVEREIIARDARIDVRPYGAITVGEKGQKLADLEAMAPYVIGFSFHAEGERMYLHSYLARGYHRE